MHFSFHLFISGYFRSPISAIIADGQYRPRSIVHSGTLVYIAVQCSSI